MKKYAAFNLYTLEPQIPIIKNIGIKILSKKKKKINRFKEVNEKINKNSIKNKQKV